jgi:hypothetical protein
VTERLVAVAHRLPSGRIRSLPAPARHYELPPALLAVPGFLTSEGRFVTREEARGVAERAGQLVAGCVESKWLYAGDLGW